MIKSRTILFLTILLLCSISVFAQENKNEMPLQNTSTSTKSSLISTADTKIPANSKIYVNPMEGGFETYIVAALQKKKIPLTIVANREQADFEIKGSVEKQ